MIVQPTFDIPVEIAGGILSGDFIRHGGVVRDTAGRLVAHLKESPTPGKSAEEVAKRAALRFNNPWGVIAVGALTLVAVGGGVVLAVKKRGNEAEPTVPECVQSYILSFRAYLEAIRSGSLDAGSIDRLSTDLDAVIAHGEEGDTTVAFSPEQLATLTQFVLEYTDELAKVNDVELDEVEVTIENAEVGPMVDLRRNLEAQRRIFGEVA